MMRANHSHQFLSLTSQYIDLELLTSSYKTLRNISRSGSKSVYSLKHIPPLGSVDTGLKLVELFFQLIVIENDKHRYDRHNF